MTSKNSSFLKRNKGEKHRVVVVIRDETQGKIDESRRKNEMNIIIIKMFIITDCYYGKLL